MKTPFRKFNKLNGGFTLVETLVGLLIFTMSILALMSVLGSSIADTNYAKKKIIAGYLAQEGIEYVRNLRDNSVLYNTGGAQAGWNAFTAMLAPQNDSVSFPITDPDFAGFNRQIGAYTTNFGSNEVKIFSTVSWTQPSGEYSIVFSDNLLNWVE